jgi:hypothetical protein
MLPDQFVNTHLLHYGARTSGTYQRRMQRLHRFIEASKLNKKKYDAMISDEMDLRGKLNQSERSAAWALVYLRNYKTETNEAVDIPTADASNYDYCVRERNGTMYYMSHKSGRSFSSQTMPTSRV